MKKRLPYKGEIFKSEKKRYEETIVFVPFFNGTKASLKRHVTLVNELGYDAVVFDLKNKVSEWSELPISSEYKFGFKHVWADQVEQVLNALPGHKIIYSFSNPSSGAIEAISRRGQSDVRALICDGGPTAEPLNSIYNYFEIEKPSAFWLLRVAHTTFNTFMLSPKFTQELHNDLDKFPEGFRLLSIRGWKDTIIKPAQIDEVFEPHLNLDWQKLSLPEGAHLNGLKDFRSEYESGLVKFLKTVSTIKKTPLLSSSRERSKLS
jgi:hypothetical protein